MASKILKVLALVAFVLAIFRVHFPADLIAVGLALWVGSEIVK